MGFELWPLASSEPWGHVCLFGAPFSPCSILDSAARGRRPHPSLLQTLLSWASVVYSSFLHWTAPSPPFWKTSSVPRRVSRVMGFCFECFALAWRASVGLGPEPGSAPQASCCSRQTGALLWQTEAPEWTHSGVRPPAVFSFLSRLPLRPCPWACCLSLALPFFLSQVWLWVVLTHHTLSPGTSHRRP